MPVRALDAASGEYEWGPALNSKKTAGTPVVVDGTVSMATDDPTEPKPSTSMRPSTPSRGAPIGSTPLLDQGATPAASRPIFVSSALYLLADRF